MRLTFVAATALCVLALPALACVECMVKVDNVRATAGEKGGRPIAIYFTLTNDSDKDEELVAVSSPVCGRAELHTHIHENGVMMMRKIDRIIVPAGGKAALKPMGDHVMCFDPQQNLKNGDSFAISLTFKSGEVIEVKDGTAKTIKDMAMDSATSHHDHHINMNHH